MQKKHLGNYEWVHLQKTIIQILIKSEGSLAFVWLKAPFHDVSNARLGSFRSSWLIVFTLKLTKNKFMTMKFE